MNILPRHFSSNSFRLCIGLLLAVLILPINALSQDKTGKLVITFTNIRSSKGHLILAVYNHPTQWTHNPHKSIVIKKEELKEGSFTAEVPGLEKGKVYACAVLDDENRSMDMEYMLGIPKEGWGMSKNPSFLKLKAPDYEDVTFLLDGPAIRFNMKMNYVRKNKKVE